MQKQKGGHRSDRALHWNCCLVMLGSSGAGTLRRHATIRKVPLSLNSRPFARIVFPTAIVVPDELAYWPANTFIP